MQIVLAKVEDTCEVISTEGVDLGRRPKVRTVPHPVSLMWLNSGTGADLEKARLFAAQQGYTVLTYWNETDPLGRAKRDVMRARE